MPSSNRLDGVCDSTPASEINADKLLNQLEIIVIQTLEPFKSVRGGLIRDLLVLFSKINALLALRHHGPLIRSPGSIRLRFPFKFQNRCQHFIKEISIKGK